MGPLGVFAGSSGTVSATGPVVSITAPAPGATVSGTVTVSANATAGTGLSIANVQFKVDNVNQGAPVTTSPYSISLDTTKLSNGVHSLTAVATDSLNIPTTSGAISITVNNGGGGVIGGPGHWIQSRRRSK